MHLNTMKKLSDGENMTQIRRISVSAGRVISHINEKNKISVHFWSPGYTVPLNKQKEHPYDPSRKIDIKEFIPTSTTEAAMAAILKRSQQFISPQEESNFVKKAHISPGHIAITAGQHYLSIGTTEKPINPIDNGEILFSDSLEVDIEGFGLGLELETNRRVPEIELNLKSLNLEQMIKFIIEIKANKKAVYNILGDRYQLKDAEASRGYSCATIVYECLNQGGFSDRMPFLKNVLLEKSILTPVSLINAAQTLRDVELELENNQKTAKNHHKLKP